MSSHCCALCGRTGLVLNRHHLIPRTRHRNKKTRKTFERGEVKQVVWICRACHDTIHAVLTEKELERNYSTTEQLLAHPEIKKFIEWVKDRPDTAGVRVKTSRRLR